ncbi:hypothetical protein KFL_004670030 [Klebsormidium nitens]|uniref:F-box domain-containing protein n=1 Tax=Klebsormidium nitens TaxID=105231 RepID=A0A0U9HN41_KLENI|nr:hypothetical protein KFL_004670030 [Klebsormidium nitens]|eukprot:GAQ88886.1 hypothetical protein KFL_004670030 [Klebsormidium nitens]
MKLRLRHYQGGPTQRLDVESDCTLRSLRAVVASLTGQSLETVRISLNKVDELDGPGNLLVSSLGVCGGDLLYLLDPRRPNQVQALASSEAGRNDVSQASAAAPVANDRSRGLQAASSTGTSEPGTRTERNGVGKVDVAQERRERCAAAAAKRVAGLAGDGPADALPLPLKAPAMNPTSMEIDNATPGATAEPPASENSEQSSISTAPPVLQEVVSTSAWAVHSAHDLLILALHAVMLETGFSLVPIGAPLEQCWERVGGRTILRYTLANRDANPTLTAILRSQQLGANLLVYGTYDGDAGGAVYRLNLALSAQLRPFPPAGERSTAELLALFKNARQLFVEAKDGLSVPLLSLLCQRAGVSPPASLILLPFDAKNNILAKLSARDLAAVAVTCSELREAASGDDFWRALFQREFPNERPAVRAGMWKEAFRMAWVDRKLQRERRLEYERQLHVGRREWRGFRYQPPGMVGGDYDRFPFGGGAGVPPGGFPGGLGGGPFGIPQGGAFPGGHLDGGFSPSLGPDALDWPHGGRARFEAGLGPQGGVGMPGIPGSNLPGFGPGLRGGPPRGGRPGRGGFSGSSII